jgi:UDP-glucose 4-epimerase
MNRVFSIGKNKQSFENRQLIINELEKIKDIRNVFFSRNSSNRLTNKVKVLYLNPVFQIFCQVSVQNRFLMPRRVNVKHFRKGKIMKILVTGGAGFIGSNVTDGFINAGHQVVVLDNLYSGKIENINPAAKFYKEDVRSKEIDRIIEIEKPDIIDHHAAQMSVPASVEDPVFDADVNIKGILNLLQSAVKHKVKKFIFISSGGAVYGEASQYPTSEEYPPIPLSPYAISKFVSEYYLNYYRHQFGLKYTILRYANVYGPRQIPHGEAGVVAIFMSNVWNKKGSNIYHFPNDDLGMIRDYCYVGDIVKANIKALSSGENDFFNIGTGRETRTQELYDVIFEAIKEIQPEIPEELSRLTKFPARAGDIARSCLIVKKAKDILGWTPEIDLNEGIRATLEWYIHSHS